MATCAEFVKPWGKCKQPPVADELICSAHLYWRDHPQAVVDSYYHEKIVKGLKSPTWDWMSDSEAHAVVNGRYRGDGRRIDQWTLPEPMGIDMRGLVR